VTRGRALLRFAVDAGKFLVAVATSWAQDRCSSMSAALAFYAAFSLAPMLVIVISVAGFFFGPAAVLGQLYSDVAVLVGPQGAAAVQALVASAWKSGQGRWVGVLSLGAIALGATGVFNELHSALDAIWKVPSPPSAVAALLRARLTSFGLVVGTGFLIVVLLIADAAITYMTEILFLEAFVRPLLGVIQHAVSLLFLCAAFCILLKVLPDTAVHWRDAAVGGVAAALLFAGGKHGFALYLAHAGTANAFGAASSLAVLMMWLFFSAAVFLFGAELSAQLSRRHLLLGAKNYKSL
jgi:membrane protein